MKNNPNVILGIAAFIFLSFIVASATDARNREYENASNFQCMSEQDTSAEWSYTELEPYSEEWLVHVLYSAKMSDRGFTWDLFLKVGDETGKTLVETKFQSNGNSASGIGALVYQKMIEHPNEKLVLYATRGLSNQTVMRFEIPADRRLPETK